MSEENNMYYHLYVEYLLQNGRNQIEEAYIKDVEKADYIKTNFVKPFISKKSMMIVSGHVIDCKSVIMFRIMKSDVKLAEIVSKKYATVPDNTFVIYTDSDALKHGFDGLLDVTLDFVNSVNQG